jgi:hypothetical protein
MGGTPGDLIIGRKVFCHTLEDVLQPPGVKIDGSTCIDAGKYHVILSMSQRFGKVLPELLDVDNFSGIRMHGGNTTEDTEGCILCAYNIISQNVIQGQAVEDLVALLRTTDEENIITILNT